MKNIIQTHEIGTKIRAFRQNAGMSQEKLAEILGVTPQQVQKYEAAKTRITTDRIQQIANALRVHVSHFFRNRAAELTLNESETAFVLKLRGIKDSNVHASLKTILDRLVK
ncbi:helix-turn-helix domain-containing protein [Oryzomonas rubra]|nr:helix-turn-helix transcriptional regulator [Oryzomonas rubra]